MGIGHKGQKNATKTTEMGNYCHLFQLLDEDSWLFSSLCKATSIILEFYDKESYLESQQMVRELDKVSNAL